MRAVDQRQAPAVELPRSSVGNGIQDKVEWLRLELPRLAGPSGWRSLAGPITFAILGTALLVFAHVNARMGAVLFWLSLGLIVTVCARMLATNRRQDLALDEYDRHALSDRTTGLDSRIKLKEDIEVAMAVPGERRALALIELEGLQAYNDRFGHAAGDELVRWTASRLVDAVKPLGGNAYRFEGSRLGVLVPASQHALSAIVLAATASLRDDETDTPIGRSCGEVILPDEAGDAELAFQIAGQRLAAHKQRQHSSARRQAHAVLTAAFRARRPELRDHFRIVTYRAISLARRLGLSREEIDDIALAAELRDIGMLSVPEAVLEKQASLEDSEKAMIHRHPLEGERIIAAAPGLAPVAHLVRSSYERYDGSGYPDGLAGEEIPIGARVISVLGAFAAMTARRPYRDPSSPREALAELHRCAGSQFDPRVVEALGVDLAEEEAAAPGAPVPLAGQPA